MPGSRALFTLPDLCRLYLSVREGSSIVALAVVGHQAVQGTILKGRV